MNIPLVPIYFTFKKNPIQPQGEPREHHLGEVRRGMSKLKTLKYEFYAFVTYNIYIKFKVHVVWLVFNKFGINIFI